MKTINCSSFLNLVILNLIFFFTEDTYSHTLRRWPRSRQGYSYLANDTACTVDDIVYREGDSIPTGDPCEVCRCRPPGFHCVVRDCPVKPGCKAIRREGECCHEYQCGCEYNGKYFNDGDAIPFEESRCYACVCQGSSITCALLKCEFRMDCEPEYIAGECCPRYEHCRQEANSSQTDTADQFDNSFDNESVIMIGSTTTTTTTPTLMTNDSKSTLGDTQPSSTPIPKLTTDGSTTASHNSSDNKPPSQNFNLSDTNVTIDENSPQLIPLIASKDQTNEKTQDIPRVNATGELYGNEQVKQQTVNSSEVVSLTSINGTLANANRQMNISSSETIEEKPVIQSEYHQTKRPNSTIKMMDSVQIEYVSANQQTKNNVSSEILSSNMTRPDERDRSEPLLGMQSTKLDPSDLVANTLSKQSENLLPTMSNTSTTTSTTTTYSPKNETVQDTTTVTLINNNNTINNDTKIAEIPPTLLEQFSNPVATVNSKHET